MGSGYYSLQYQLFVSNLLAYSIRYSYQNSFVTNQVELIIINYLYHYFLKAAVSKVFFK